MPQVSAGNSRPAHRWGGRNAIASQRGSCAQGATPHNLHHLMLSRTQLWHAAAIEIAHPQPRAVLATYPDRVATGPCRTDPRLHPVMPFPWPLVWSPLRSSWRITAAQTVTGGQKVVANDNSSHLCSLQLPKELILTHTLFHSLSYAVFWFAQRSKNW